MKLICREGDVNLTKDNFVYAESELHYVGIWVLENDALQKYSLRITLDGLEKQITVSDIWRIHKSYLVNLKYVESVERYRAVLSNGKSLAISKARFLDTRNEFACYRGEI